MGENISFYSEDKFMKNDFLFHKSHKLVVTLAMMIALVGLSGGVSWYMSQIEEQRCWDLLQ